MARAFPQGRINRAKALTFLRFQPQEGALTALLADLAQQRKQQLSAAHGGAASMLATLSGVRPQLEGIYSQAGQEHQIAQNESQGALQGLSGPAVDAIRAATARENAGYGNRLATAKASGLSEIGQRQTSTRAGEIAASAQANKVYGTEASKVFDQLASLAAQKGAFINTTLADLTDAARKQAIAKSNLKIGQQRVGLEKQGVQLRQQDIGLKKQTAQETHRHNVAGEQTAQYKATHPGKGTKKGRAQTEGQSKLKDQLITLEDEIRAKGIDKKGHGAVMQFLMTDEKDSKGKVTQKGVNSLKARSVADQVVLGHLKPGTRKRLHDTYGIRGF